MLIYRIDNLKNLSNKDFMVSFAGIVNDFDLLQKEDIENLQDHDWCRDNIKHEYTIIKSISKNVSNTLVEEKKIIRGDKGIMIMCFTLEEKMFCFLLNGMMVQEENRIIKRYLLIG